MKRRHVFGLVGATMLALIAARSRAGDNAVVAPRPACACCGESCSCAACACDASATLDAACDCCDGPACCVGSAG